MATECDRASLARVAELDSDFRPLSRRSALVARTNAASVRGPALAGMGNANIPATSKNSTSRRRTDMGALLRSGPGTGHTGMSTGQEGPLRNSAKPRLLAGLALGAGLVRRQ